MTASRDFKKLVRARMKDTGENYTTARAALLKTKTAPRVLSGDEVKQEVAKICAFQDLVLDRKPPAEAFAMSQQSPRRFLSPALAADLRLETLVPESKKQ